MSLIQYNPWPVFESLRRDLEQSFQGRDVDSEPVWQPQVDILEYKDRYELHADLPGVAPDAVDIDLEDGMLTLSGQRERFVPTEDGPERVRREILGGRFQRRFHLPRTVVAAEVTARAENGVLVISIPKHAQAQPIRVKVAA